MTDCNKVRATVKSTGYKFSFFKAEGFDKDAIAWPQTLEQSSITKLSVGQEVYLVNLARASCGKLTVTEIHGLAEDQSALQESTTKSRITRTNQKRTASKEQRAPGEAPVLTMQSFYRVAEQVACNEETGICLHAVYNCRGQLAQYLFVKNGRPLCSTGRVPEARAVAYLKMVQAYQPEPA